MEDPWKEEAPCFGFSCGPMLCAGGLFHAPLSAVWYARIICEFARIRRPRNFPETDKASVVGPAFHGSSSGLPTKLASAITGVTHE